MTLRKHECIYSIVDKYGFMLEAIRNKSSRTILKGLPLRLSILFFINL